MKPATLKRQYSSGGVIFRVRQTGIDVVLTSVRGGAAWCLPKGLIAKSEEPEETALREVREETGLSAQIVSEIGSISYWYFLKEENVKCHKTVRFYLMSCTGGNTRDHDSEVDEARWFPVEEAIELLTYEGERQIVRKAEDLIREMPTAERDR